MHGSEDNTRYDLEKYPLAVGGFQPAHRGEDGQYYLLPGLPTLPTLPDTPDAPLPGVWRRGQSEGECGLPEAAGAGEKPATNGLPRVPAWLCWALVAAVLLLVLRNLPHVRDWSCWR